MFEIIPGKDGLLDGLTLRPRHMEAGCCYSRWTHAISEKKDNVLSDVCVQFNSIYQGWDHG